MKLLWSVWLLDEMEQVDILLLQLHSASFQNFPLLKGRIVEVIQTQPLISLLHYHPDWGG